jgi:hypothetical protein
MASHSMVLHGDLKIANRVIPWRTDEAGNLVLVTGGNAVSVLTVEALGAALDRQALTTLQPEAKNETTPALPVVKKRRGPRVSIEEPSVASSGGEFVVKKRRGARMKQRDESPSS